MISIKQIKYALAVEQYLHFKKAADACSISQSALSNALTEMEKQLGFQIFERDNKKVLVTPLGAEVLNKAREIYLQVVDLSKLAEEASQPLSTPLTIGIIPTIAPYLLPRILPEIQTNYPNLALSIVEDQSHVLVDEVIKGNLDTAILALPYDCQGLLTFNFWKENLYWVTHKEDPLAQNESISAEEMKTAKIMLLKDGHCLKDHAISACKLPVETPFSLGGASLITLVELVAGKLGTTLVPEIALRQLVEANPQLKAVPLAEPGPHREFSFIVRPNYPSVQHIEILTTLIRQILRH